VTDREQAERTVEQAWQEIGPLDLLCSNAGVFVPGPLIEASAKDIEFQFDVNVWGGLNVCRPFVRRLREAGRPGHILMTGSEHSLSTPSYLRPLPIRVYNMTKHCVLAMADCLRAELEPDGIGVSVLCPGPVASGLADNTSAFRPARYAAEEGAQGEATNLLDGVDDELMKKVQGYYQSAPQAVATAINGLRKGLFVIPTHAYILEDATERFREIERGFDAMNL
jgi:NAD(P)-dependent dehydrogenase (short-subunit alcohol dehydrogenase family)